MTQVQLVAEGSTSSMGSPVNVGKASSHAPRLQGRAFSECLGQLKTTQTLADLEAWIAKTERVLNLHRLGRPEAGMSREAWRTQQEKEQAEREAAPSERHSDRRRILIAQRLSDGRTYREIADELGSTPGSIRKEAQRIRLHNASDAGQKA